MGNDPIVTIREVPADEAGALCEPVLRALPDWFGIEAALVAYLADMRRMRTWVAETAPATVAGFVTLHVHNAHTGEVHVMGVRTELHRRGVGRALIDAVERALRASGHVLLEVKTLGPSRDNAAYARTRAFYEAAGFVPLEELAEIWGPANPCLIMVKCLRADAHATARAPG